MYNSRLTSAQQDEPAIIVRDTMGVRELVVTALAQYLELSVKMREFEEIFGNQVLGAASELLVLREKCKRLEMEYHRIEGGISRGRYRSLDEIQSDVDKALALPDIDDLDGPAQRADSGGPKDPSDSEYFDEAAKARIVRAFRRIVLPNVHPDTSSSEYADFEFAYSAYKNMDYTLMEALTIRYCGEVDLEQDGQLLTLMQLKARLNDYRAAYGRLDLRLRILQQNASPAELNVPEQAKQRMVEQRELFHQAIIAEAEKESDLQSRLRALVDDYSIRRKRA